MNEIKVLIDSSLTSYMPEIEYVLGVLSSRFDRRFKTVKTISEDEFFISYGNDLGTISLPATFFLEYVELNENGISLKKLPENIDSFDQDILGLIFFLLSRIEEKDRSDLDNHDRFKLENTFAYKNDFHNRPEVDYQINKFVSLLKQHDIELTLKKDINIFLTHDVDRLRPYHSYYELIRRFGGHMAKKRMSLQKGLRLMSKEFFSGEPKNSFRYLMDQSEQLGLKSTFFIMPFSPHSKDAQYVKNFPKDLLSIVRETKKRGHEIGIHPGYYTYNDKVKLKNQKDKLENFLDIPLQKVRQHVLRWAPETSDIHSELGFHEDFTLAFPQGCTFRSSTTHRYKAYSLKQRKELNHYIVPTNIMEFALFMDKYVSIDRLEALKLIKNSISEYEKFGGDLVILFHTITVMQMNDEYQELLQMLPSTRL